MLCKTIDYWLFKCYRAVLFNTLSNQATVLMFHRVDQGNRFGVNDYIDAAEFELKVKLLNKYFNVISVPTLVALNKTKDLPPLSVVITIDDGYKDSYSVVTPILDQLNIKGAFFIATEGLEKGGLWNDRISEAVLKTEKQELKLFTNQSSLPLATSEQKRASWKAIHDHAKFLSLMDRESLLDELEAKLLPSIKMSEFLTEAEIIEMHSAGMTIGAHTEKHPILVMETDESAYHEIKKSKETLERIITDEVKYFAYPNGKFGRDFNLKHKEMVKEIGFEAAFSTDVGIVNQDTDLMSIPRFTPWDKEPASFSLRLCHHFYKNK